MKSKIIKNKKNKIIFGMIFLVILILLIVPGIMAVFMKEPVFSKAPGEVEAWISFWGSYLGGIVGMIAVVVTTIFLIEIQNLHHEQQLKQQQREITDSINSSKEIEREKFMVQFNIEKYEYTLKLLNKLESKIDFHVKSYNEVFEFVFKYFNYEVSDGLIPNDEYRQYTDIVDECYRDILNVLSELRNLEKIIKPFNCKNIDEEALQYLNSTRQILFFLNSDRRGEAIKDQGSYLNNLRLRIVESRNTVYEYIKKELDIYNVPQVKNEE